MDIDLDHELAFLNVLETLDIPRNETKAQNKEMETNNLKHNSEKVNTSNSKLENYLEKENVLRLIIEKWNVVADTESSTDKKAVTDKEDVLKSIIYNWQV
jgi:hypothetical protein